MEATSAATSSSSDVSGLSPLGAGLSPTVLAVVVIAALIFVIIVVAALIALFVINRRRLMRVGPLPSRVGAKRSLPSAMSEPIGFPDSAAVPSALITYPGSVVRCNDSRTMVHDPMALASNAESSSMCFPSKSLPSVELSDTTYDGSNATQAAPVAGVLPCMGLALPQVHPYTSDAMAASPRLTDTPQDREASRSPASRMIDTGTLPFVQCSPSGTPHRRSKGGNISPPCAAPCVTSHAVRQPQQPTPPSSQQRRLGGGNGTSSGSGSRDGGSTERTPLSATRSDVSSESARPSAAAALWARLFGGVKQPSESDDDSANTSDTSNTSDDVGTSSASEEP